MKKGGTFGGNTVTGLHFEARVDFCTMIGKIPGYTVGPIETGIAGIPIRFESEIVARCYKKDMFYKFLEQNNVDWRSKISCKLLPDDAVLVVVRKTLFIIEVKFQTVAGSVDEKLQTCDFKRKKYLRLVADLGIFVEYVYVLNDWFRKPQYKDTLEYIHSVNCHYHFNTLPLAWLGLPSE